LNNPTNRRGGKRKVQRGIHSEFKARLKYITKPVFKKLKKKEKKKEEKRRGEGKGDGEERRRGRREWEGRGEERNNEEVQGVLRPFWGKNFVCFVKPPCHPLGPPETPLPSFAFPEPTTLALPPASGFPVP
jgi:hypothetical protein